MSAVAGLLSASNIGTTNDLVGEFQETIFVRNAKGLNVGSTLFGLMAKLKSEPADNIEYNWFERNPVRRVIYTNGGNMGTTDTSLTFDDGAGNSVWPVLASGNVLRNDRTGEYIRVNGDPTTDAITVQRDLVSSSPTAAPSGTGVAIQNRDTWTIVTLGKDEGSDPTRGAYENPVTLINYVQTFNSSVYLTNAFKGQVLRSDIEGPLTDRRIQALERIARDIEFAYFFGRQKRIAGTNGYVYLTGGILDSLIQAGLSSTNILNGLTTQHGNSSCTLAEFNSWLSNFMTYGSDAKLAFCGPTAYSVVSTFANSAANGYRIMQGETVFGMHITTINTPFGELSLAYHPLLKEATAYNNWMFVFDLPLVVQKTFEPLFLEPDIQTPGQDTYKEQYRAKLGLKLKFANAFGVAQSISSITAS
jgi:hypothetical protein